MNLSIVTDQHAFLIIVISKPKWKFFFMLIQIGNIIHMDMISLVWTTLMMVFKLLLSLGNTGKEWTVLVLKPS